MSKFVLDTSGLSYVNEGILALESEMIDISSSVSSYDVGEASEFDFGGAIRAISSNIEAAADKIKNTTKLIKNVIDTHTNIQNNLKFTIDTSVTKNDNTVKVQNSNKSNSSTSGIKSSSSNGSSRNPNKTSSNSTEKSVNATSTNVTEEVKEFSSGTKINVPTGLGSVHTYMGWQLITSKTSMQYKLKETAGMNFDKEGFGIIDGRYVIACTTTFGQVGDYIDFVQEDGTVLKCIIGDIKNQNDRGCTKWGHNNGKTVVEFVVDKNTWYGSNHSNPGTANCHPEWNQNIVSATNYGNYFDKK